MLPQAILPVDRLPQGSLIPVVCDLRKNLSHVSALLLANYNRGGSRTCSLVPASRSSDALLSGGAMTS